VLTRSLGRVVASFAVALIGCSTTACGLDQAVRHEVRITIKDPTKRLGAPPWHVEVGAIGEGMASGYASPDSPFRGAFTQFRGTSDHWLTARSRSQEIALNIPALGRGQWQGIVRVSYVGTCEGHARFVDLGPPDPEAETLFLRGTAWPNPKGNGWSLDLRTEIPAAPTPEVIMAKRHRRGPSAAVRTQSHIGASAAGSVAGRWRHDGLHARSEDRDGSPHRSRHRGSSDAMAD
jgi:hypothetical protein